MPEQLDDWEEMPDEGWYTLKIDGFVLRVEYAADDCYRVAVISGDRYGALYRSTRCFPLERAKSEAISAGRKVALRQAKRMKKIAECLGKERS